MKTEEDEAFDDLARKQGDWGGGYQAKRAMAADKQEPWNEDEWRRNNWRCGHGWLRGEQCEICNAPQPVQEPVGYVYSEAGVKHGAIERDLPNGTPLYTAQPAQRPWVGLTSDERLELYRQFEDCLESDGWEYEKAIETKLKEKNT